MSAPAFISKGTLGEGNGSSISPSYPGGIQAGDILFLLAANQQIGEMDAGTIATPAGWTALSESNPFPNGEGGAKLFYKVAAGSESGSFSVTRTGATGNDTAFAAQVYQYRSGAGGGAGLETNQGQYGTDDVTITWPTITIVGNSRTLLAFVVLIGSVSGDPIDTPAGYSADAFDAVNPLSQRTLLQAFSLEDINSDGSVSVDSRANFGWFTIHASIFDVVGRSFIVN